jgi:eukaryotic-like serine/threonine-protein kinase
MHARLLVITDQSEFARLVEYHLTTFWPDAEVKTHSPEIDGELHAAFTAAAFDVVVLDDAVDAGHGVKWLQDLGARAEFPPIIYCSPALTPAKEQELKSLGADEVLGRDRIEHRRFANAARDLLAKRRRELGSSRSQSKFEQRYRFGPVTIRGQRFIKELGKGGTSQVYLAESEKAGEIVVLKVIGQHTAETQEGYDRFLQEYELVSRIEHPNIVKIYDLGVADDHAYIAMEYFPAGDLRRRMAAPMSVAEALNLFEQIARALEAVHAVGVMHRDLKPGNIMLRSASSLALIDFGLAKQLSRNLGLTVEGEIFGTPYYMSPEQGHGEDVDVRSDLYSLGVVFYELLTRKRPYTSNTVMNVIYMHRNSPLPELPAPLSAFTPLVHRLLAKRREDRFQSASEVLGELSRLRASLE